MSFTSGKCLASGLQGPGVAVSNNLHGSSSSGGGSEGSCCCSSSSEPSVFGLSQVVAPQMDLAMFKYMESVGKLEWYTGLCTAYYASCQSTCRSVRSAASSVSSRSAVVKSLPVSEVKPKVDFRQKRKALFTKVGLQRAVDTDVPLSEERISSYGEGYCYLRAVLASRADVAAKLLGPWPTIGKLISTLSSSDVLSIAKLRCIGVEYEVGKAHVTVGVAKEKSFFSMLCTLRVMIGSSYGLLLLTNGSEAYDKGANFGLRIGGMRSPMLPQLGTDADFGKCYFALDRCTDLAAVGRVWVDCCLPAVDSPQVRGLLQVLKVKLGADFVKLEMAIRRAALVRVMTVGDVDYVEDVRFGFHGVDKAVVLGKYPYLASVLEDYNAARGEFPRCVVFGQSAGRGFTTSFVGFPEGMYVKPEVGTFPYVFSTRFLMLLGFYYLVLNLVTSVSLVRAGDSPLCGVFKSGTSSYSALVVSEGLPQPLYVSCGNENVVGFGMSYDEVHCLASGLSATVKTRVTRSGTYDHGLYCTGVPCALLSYEMSECVLRGQVSL